MADTRLISRVLVVLDDGMGARVVVCPSETYMLPPSGHHGDADEHERANAKAGVE